MKNIIKIITEKKWALAVVCMGIGLFAGWIFFGDRSSGSDAGHIHGQNENQVWTCSMHPNIKLPEPVPCPICGMDLIIAGSPENGDSLTLVMGEPALKLARIQVSPVMVRKAEKEILLQGRVKVDERNIFQVSSRYSGRIDRLLVDYTGAEVGKGQQLATLYSPELVAAQTEFFDATSVRTTYPGIYIAARNKLRRWHLSEEHIEGLERGEPVKKVLGIHSPITGTVTKRTVTEGQYVNEGSSLFEIVNLRKIWVLFDVYEDEVAWLNIGNEINFTVPSIPGKQFSGKVTFIDPVVNPSTRTVSVRIEADNRAKLLKPEMFVNGWLYAFTSDEKPSLTIPKSAVLWTGKRSVVYVQLPDEEKPTFRFREITLGPDLGNHYVVVNGLKLGENVVTNGAFKIDAAAQLAGKYSMMNPPASASTPSPVAVPADFKKQLEALAGSYFNIKNSLTETSVEKTREAASEMMKNLTKTEKGKLSSEAHRNWAELETSIHHYLGQIIDENKIENQRIAFKHLSGSMAKMLRVFPVNSIPVYQAYCPMAFNDQGAYWLSETEEIRNPYFGDKMMKCGLVKNVFEVE